MVLYKTHLTVLEESAAKWPSSPVFQLPVLEEETGRLRGWKPVTYGQFQADVELFARYWNRSLTADGVPPRSVVGLW